MKLEDRRWLGRAALLAWLGAIFLLVAFLWGCALPDQVIRKGEYAPGRYLVTMTITDNASEHCVTTRTGVKVKGCAKIGLDSLESTMIFPTFLVISRAESTNPEIYVHEFCHAIWGLWVMQVGSPFRDPCHKEDGGKLR